ncbi:MAG TPA: hypothetical protein PKW37_02465 [Salinivirgaceae bacterium]|nr:hypothetical protein [Salinivirgaceae bacterium]
MRNIEELQHDYQKYLTYLHCGRYGFTYDELDQHSVEELETMADFGWSDDISEELYEILMLRRKRKLNQQFVFNRETIQEIVELDKKLTNCCRELRKETEELYNQMQEQNRYNFTINGEVVVQGSGPFIDCALTSINENLLSFSISSRDGIEQLNLISIFNFERNYANRILSYNTERAVKVFDETRSCHIGYPFFLLYRKSCLSLYDILEICGLQKEINIRYRSDFKRIENK